MIEVVSELRDEILSEIQAIGPTDNMGRSFLVEKQYKEIRQFKVEIFPNESTHRGRPHCKVTTDKGAVTVDISNGGIIAGTAGHWTRTIQKVVLSHSDGLKRLWDEMRPDDQKL